MTSFSNEEGSIEQRTEKYYEDDEIDAYMWGHRRTVGIFTTIHLTDLVMLRTVAICWRILAIWILPHGGFLSNADLEPLTLLDSIRLF